MMKLNREEGLYSKEDIIEMHENLMSTTIMGSAHNEIIERFIDLVYEQGYENTHLTTHMTRNELEDKLECLRIARSDILY